MPNANYETMPTAAASPRRTTGRRRAPNPYLQVALTYLRRPVSSVPGAMLCASFLLMAVGVLPVMIHAFRRENDISPIQMPLMFMLGLFYCIAIHVRDQFVNARARLMPGYRRVHTAVAVVVVFLLTVAWPTVVIWLADLRSVGLIAVMVFLFGTVFYATAARASVFAWLIWLGFMLSLTPPAKTFLWQLISGQSEVLAVALLAIGVGLILLGGLRLIGLTEEMPEYQLTPWGGQSNRGTISQPQSGTWKFGEAWRERSIEARMARWIGHARRASTSWWSRVCRWELGMPIGWPTVAFLVFIFTVSSATGLRASGLTLRDANAVFPAIMFFLMPTSMLWGAMRRGRLPMAARELLLPVDRRSYVRQLGVATAVGQLRLAAGMGIGIVILYGLLTWPVHSLTTLVVLLGIFALVQPWFFGVGAWFLRYRNLGAQFAGVVLAVLLPMIPGALCAEAQPGSPWQYLALPVAAVIGACGLPLTYFAYRHWLVADID